MFTFTVAAYNRFNPERASQAISPVIWLIASMKKNELQAP